LTTGWMFVYTIQPVVKPVVQPAVSCKRGIKVTSGSVLVVWLFRIERLSITNPFSRFPVLQFGAAFSSLAFSSPAVWCRVFQFRVFQSRVFSAPIYTPSSQYFASLPGAVTTPG